MSQTQIIVGLGVVVTLLWGLSLLLLKNQITNVLTSVNRLPPQKWFDDINARVQELPGRHWFDEVHKSIKGLPDPERLAEHFARVHKLTNDVNILTLRAEDLRMELKEQKETRRLDREHMVRVEDRLARNESRLSNLDGEKGSDRRETTR